MKKIYTLLTALLLTATLWAQSPEKISYQAVIRDANSALVKNQTVGMKISVLQWEALMPVVYVETQTPTTNANGLVSLEIGSGTVIYENLTTINWANGSYFIITETDPTGGSTYTISDTSQLLSVPYALHAKIAENYNETDPVFLASLANAISETDTAYWNNKLDEELDPVFLASLANAISETDTAYWNSKLDEELDPVFLVSLANAISGTDTAYWNNKLDGLDEFEETDPEFLAHVSSGITAEDISDWERIRTRYLAEEDYLAVNSPAGGITADDTTRWNTYTRVFSETDPIFTSSYASYITASDTTHLNNLSGTNTGDQNMDDYVTKVNLSDSIEDVLRGSIDNFRSALRDSMDNSRSALSDSMERVREEDLSDSIANFRIALKDSIYNFRIALNDSIDNFRSALNDSIDSFRIALKDSTTKIRKDLSDSIEIDYITRLTDSIAQIREEVSDVEDVDAVVSLIIGDEYGGGTIFWLDESGIHGLIAADLDSETSTEWGLNMIVNADANGVYSGMSNTNTIITVQGESNYAADTCANYIITTNTDPAEYYDDWYLPSIYELLLLHEQKDVVGNFSETNNGNYSDAYWSSTEDSQSDPALNALAIGFADGRTFSYQKGNLNYFKVRPIRAF